MSDYTALKHFIRAHAELFMTEEPEKGGVKAAGSTLGLTYDGETLVTISASMPTEDRVSVVTVHDSEGGLPGLQYMRAVHTPWDAEKIAAEAVREARWVYFREVQNRGLDDVGLF